MKGSATRDTLRRLAILTMAILLGLTAVACGGETKDDTDTETEPGEAELAPPRLAITTRDYKFDAPTSVQGGLTRMEVTNAGKHAHQVQLFRLNDGVDLKTFTDALLDEKNPGAVFGVSVVAGGIAELGPGRSSTVIGTLEEGTHALVCFVDGHHFTKKMIGAIEVTAPEELEGPTPLPEDFALGDVRTADFTIVLPEGFDGTGLYTVSNAGPQPHEVTIFKVDADLDELTKYLQKPKGPPPGGPPEGWGGVGAQVSGATSFINLVLEPGVYAMLCFVPDQKTGKSHFELGMAAPFEVK